MFANTVTAATINSSADITVFTSLSHNIKRLGAHDSDVFSTTTLTCGTLTDPSIRLQHSWYVGDTPLPPTTPDDRIFQQNGLVFRSDVPGTSLILSKLTYMDSGQYRCESRGQRSNTREVVSDSLTITLKLIGNVHKIEADVV